MNGSSRAALERIKVYVPGTSPEEIARRHGSLESIKLSSNENPFGAGKLAVEAARQAANELHLYPDGASRRLKAALAQRFGVDVGEIAVGCGADELIRMLGEAYLEPKRAAVFADVTFSQYAFVARLMGADEVVVPLKNGVHDLWEMAYTVRKRRATLCFICNPNNPTGTYVNAAEVMRFLDAIPPETLVVFDEAYIEYADAPDLPDTLSLIKEGRPVVSLRTFSKIHGLAGLRVGYAIAPAHVVSVLEKVRPPFNVNRVAQAAACAALDDAEHFEMSRRVNNEERASITRGLEELGLRPYPSQSNFVWVDLGVDSDAVYEALIERGIIVRQGSSFNVPTALRISIGTPEQNRRMLAALGDVMASVQAKGEVDS